LPMMGHFLSHTVTSSLMFLYNWHLLRCPRFRTAVSSYAPRCRSPRLDETFRQGAPAVRLGRFPPMGRRRGRTDRRLRSPMPKRRQHEGKTADRRYGMT